jgi:hypothetical protein
MENGMASGTLVAMAQFHIAIGSQLLVFVMAGDFTWNVGG